MTFRLYLNQAGKGGDYESNVEYALNRTLEDHEDSEVLDTLLDRLRETEDDSFESYLQDRHLLKSVEGYARLKKS